MIKACIFDLDGTLADTLDSMAYVTNIIMEKFGLKTLPVNLPLSITAFTF